MFSCSIGGQNQRPEKRLQYLSFKVGVGNLSLVSLRKKPITTFQHFVIQVVWKNIRLVLLSLALYSDHDRTFSQSQSFQRACVPTGCFKLHILVTGDVATSWLAVKYKWHALHCKTGLWWLDKLSCRRHRQPAWVELRWTSLHRCNFPCNRLVSSKIFAENWTLKRERDNKRNKRQAGAKTGRGGGRWFLRSLMLQLAWFTDTADLSFTLIWFGTFLCYDIYLYFFI